jgi:hypothetical protein
MPYKHCMPASACPFPADGHYERKAWTVCAANRSRGKRVFWNVMAPAA